MRVIFKSAHVFSSCPVWYLESLEKGSWSSIEGAISDSFEEGMWVEVLSINVMHVIWFLVEFVVVEVIDTDSYDNK